MTRRLPPMRRSVTRIAEPEALRSLPGTWVTDRIAVIQDAFAELVAGLTDDTMQVIAQNFDDIEFRGGHRDSKALRKAIREVVIEKLITALGDQVDENEAEPDVVARLRVTTTREMLVELLAERGR